MKQQQVQFSFRIHFGSSHSYAPLSETLEPLQTKLVRLLSSRSYLAPRHDEPHFAVSILVNSLRGALPNPWNSTFPREEQIDRGSAAWQWSSDGGDVRYYARLL